MSDPGEYFDRNLVSVFSLLSFPLGLFFKDTDACCFS